MGPYQKWQQIGVLLTLPLETGPMESVSSEGLGDWWLTREGAALVTNPAVLRGATDGCWAPWKTQTALGA